VISDDRTLPPLALAFDDVLIVPRRSHLRSRADVSTASWFTTGIPIQTPIVSANMDTVTTAPMAIAMAQLGGLGVIHRFLSIQDQAAEVARVKRYLHFVIDDPYTIEPTESWRLRVPGRTSWA
jgi:IMP dehydrogenase